MTSHRLVLVLVAVALGGCTALPDPLRTPTPAEVPGLEQAHAADPLDPDVALQLAAAYRAADRNAEALGIVERVRADVPDDPGLTVMAGLLNEDTGTYGTAQALYEAFLADTPSGALAEQVERRLELVRREVLREQVRASLAREAELARTTPDPAAVGVFPFRYEGDDPAWEPLGLALAELLVTDLGVTGRLTVLERARVQSLLQEMALAEAGLVQEETAARSGRLLGAGFIVQGSYRLEGDERIGVDAAVVEVGAPGQVTVDPVSSEDAVERLFELEKRLALDVHAEMGIELTAAERVRIDERQTESVLALLAFGRGLAARDVGDFDEARSFFQQATEIDPDFALAQTQELASARSAAATRANAVAMQGQAVRLAQQKRMVATLRNAPASVRQRVLANLGQRQRAALAEILGQDRVGTSILLELVFTAPGGGR